MPFAYYRRLDARRRRIYDRSAAVTSLPVPGASFLHPCVREIEAALSAGNRRDTERAVTEFARRLLERLRVPPVRVRVLSRRPSRSWGELHGLYEPAETPRERPVLTVWMRTAARKEVVAFRAFLRTVLHELMHHLDYELFEFEDSLHTEGFYKRESSLFRQLVPQSVGGSRRKRSAAETRTPGAGAAGRDAAAARRGTGARSGSDRRRSRGRPATAGAGASPQLDLFAAGSDENGAGEGAERR